MSFIDHLHKEFKIVEDTELEPGHEKRLEQIYSILTMNLPSECKFILENYAWLTLELKHRYGYEITIALSGTRSFLVDLITMQERGIEITGNFIPIGNDIGDLWYVYGMGNEGLGLYLTESSILHKNDYIKLADSISDFFCKGIGIEKLKDS